MTKNTYSLGIDIGGTFTDIVLYGHADARVYSHKELTTPEEPANGAMEGIRKLLKREKIIGSQISRVVHATTLFTNALIERKGVKTGLITTAGFRDTLEMRREFKYDLYDLFIEMPAPLIPRDLRLEAVERVTAAGEIDVPLDEESILRAGRALVAQGVQSVAVVFLHAYANAAHELRARDLLRAFPSLAVSISSEVCPQIREYERTSTTAANAYVQPMADRYLGSMEERLRGAGIECPLFMMLSNGGLTHAGEARRFPVQLLESGPAAGAIAAAYFGKRSGVGDVLAFDMGGTTAKLSIVENNNPLIAYSFEAGREKRFAAGSGLPINISTVELIEVGAGGGSIARLDSLGLMKVGPQSAGSRPGPACYARGGIEPTVTDANLLLGHLEPTTFAGGTMRLDARAAHKCVDPLAEKLGLSTHTVADGVLSVVNENMAAAARVHAAERGFDPPRFTLLVTGGGGPLHGCDVAQRLGISRVICPPGAGVASALGLLIAPARVDRSTTLNKRLGEVSAANLEAVYRRLEQSAAEVMDLTLEKSATFDFARAADIRFVGQGFELVTELPSGPFDGGIHADVRRRFSEDYRRVFGQVPLVDELELINLRVTARERNVERALNLSPRQNRWEPASNARSIWSRNDQSYANAPIHSIEGLAPGENVHGPAVLEDAFSTLLVPVGAVAKRDEAGNIIVDLKSPASA